MRRLTPLDKEILHIAIPAIVTNITVPLLGLVDLSIVGHMGDAAYIGSIAVGTMIFNVICWLFGFLRMGTSGLTSQAFGRHRPDEATVILKQSLGVGTAIGLIFVALQHWVKQLAFTAMAPTEAIALHASAYFDICIYSVPATLALYGLTGWYIGMQNTRIPMWVSIFQNVVNIAASLTFVYVLGMKVEGVALGTVVAQYAGLVLALWHLRRFRTGMPIATTAKGKPSDISITRFFSVNRDIFLRTVFLVAVNFCFTSIGARQGSVILAVNTLLFQLFTLYSYVMDGFAYAGEALCGKYYGAQQRMAFDKAVHRIFLWCMALTAIYTLVYLVGTFPFLHVMADNEQVLSTAREYAWWATAIPLAGMGAFYWDGIYIGITATRGMMQATFTSAAVFLATYFLSFPLLHNHGLWLALILYLATRGIVQTILFRGYRLRE